MPPPHRNPPPYNQHSLWSLMPCCMALLAKPPPALSDTHIASRACILNTTTRLTTRRLTTHHLTTSSMVARMVSRQRRHDCYSSLSNQCRRSRRRSSTRCIGSMIGSVLLP